MSFSLFGMDTGFYSRLGAYPLDVRCEMLAELGYDATYLTLWSEPAWADLPHLGACAARNGLGVAAVNVTVDEPGESGRLIDMIRGLSCTSTVEITIRSARDDADALRFLESALKAAEESGVRLLLYPHTFFWMEQLRDAVRLCATVGADRLGVVFPAFHWYAVEGEDLRAALVDAAPYLGLVNVCGSRRVSGQYFPATIEPLDSGEFDNFALLGALRELGYEGMVGVQGYGIGGDAYEHFRRSITAFRAMCARLDAHPAWARLRPDHI